MMSINGTSNMMPGIEENNAVSASVKWLNTQIASSAMYMNSKAPESGKLQALFTTIKKTGRKTNISATMSASMQNITAQPPAAVPSNGPEAKKIAPTIAITGIAANVQAANHQTAILVFLGSFGLSIFCTSLNGQPPAPL
jgi:hypothetical protein